MFVIAIRLFLFITLLTGIVYPLFVTVLAQVLWHGPANGSFITVKDKVVGSRLIGQEFSDKKYFWSRPSAVNYQPMQSGGSNLSPTNPKLKEQINERTSKILAAHPGSKHENIPSDLLYTSGSGVDPHITVHTAMFQVDRIALARGWNKEKKDQIRRIIHEKSTHFLVNYVNVPIVNVLELNIALDELK